MRLATECFLEAPKEFKEAVCRYAAIHGRDDILEFGISFGLPMHKVFDEKWETLSSIVKNGHMDTFMKKKIAMENDHRHYLHDTTY